MKDASKINISDNDQHCGCGHGHGGCGGHGHGGCGCGGACKGPENHKAKPSSEFKGEEKANAKD